MADAIWATYPVMTILYKAMIIALDLFMPFYFLHPLSTIEREEQPAHFLLWIEL